MKVGTNQGSNPNRVKRPVVKKATLDYLRLKPPKIAKVVTKATSISAQKNLGLNQSGARLRTVGRKMMSLDILVW